MIEGLCTESCKRTVPSSLITYAGCHELFEACGVPEVGLLGLGWIGARHRVTAVLDHALAEITPDPSAADTGPAQAAGMLHLTAALNHARQNRAGDADDHLDE